MKAESGIALTELVVASLIGATLLVEVGFVQSNFTRWAAAMEARAKGMKQARLARVFLANDWLLSDQMDRDGSSISIRQGTKQISYRRQAERVIRTNDQNEGPIQTISNAITGFEFGTQSGAGLRIQWKWLHGNQVTRMETSIVPVK